MYTQKAFESVNRATYGDAAAFLAAFKAAGCYLLNLCEQPVNGMKGAERRRACKEGIPVLARTLAELRPRAVIGVKLTLQPHIRRAIADAGIEEPGLYMLPFPAFQHGPKYVSRLVESLKRKQAARILRAF